MGKSKYYLIAKRKNSSDYKIINLENNESFRYSDEKEKLSLERLDYFTMKFDNSSELNEYLISKGRIDNEDNDYFIARRKGEELTFFNPVYSSCSRRLSKVTYDSSRGSINNAYREINEIFDKFLSTLFYEDDFEEYVMNGCTNIYEKFCDYFRENVGSIDEYFEALKKCRWSFSSYTLIRNVEEAIDSYKKGKCVINRYNLDRRGSDISSIINKLLVETDESHFDGQLNLFDFMDSKGKVYEKKDN